MNYLLLSILCLVGFIENGYSTPSPTSSTCITGDLRLASYTTYTSGSYYYSGTYYAYKIIGRLEFYYYSQWGTVCDDLFGDIDADVACKQLGYSAGALYATNIASTSTSQCTWLDSVSCLGTESKLSYCSHAGYGNEDCSHSEDVAITCYGSTLKYATCGSYTSTTYPGICPATVSTPSPVSSSSTTTYYCSQGDLRLTSTSLASTSYYSGTYYTYGVTGRLEIYYNSEWGTVCDDSFSSTDAAVACKQLGYTTGSFYGNYAGTSTSQCIWLDYLACTGTESELSYCSSNGWGSGNNLCSHTEDVAITCYGSSIKYATCGYYTSTYYSGYCPTQYEIANSSYSYSSYSALVWYLILVYILVPIIVLCCVGYWIYQCCCKAKKPVPYVAPIQSKNSIVTIPMTNMQQPFPTQMMEGQVQGQPTQQFQPQPFQTIGGNNPYPYYYGPDGNAYYYTPGPQQPLQQQQQLQQQQPSPQQPQFIQQQPLQQQAPSQPQDLQSQPQPQQQEQQPPPMYYSIPTRQSVDQPMMMMYNNNQSQRQLFSQPPSSINLINSVPQQQSQPPIQAFPMQIPNDQQAPPAFSMIEENHHEGGESTLN